MAQVVLDVLYNVKGMQALKASQQAMNGAANAAQASTNKIRGYNAATGKTAVAAGKAAAGNKVAANSYRATGFAAVGATGGVKSFGVALSAALGPIAAITGGMALLGKTISVFSERERDTALLTNGLKNLGLQGTPALDALQRSADKLGKTTLFDQEQFTRGFALLTSFRSIGVSSYERVATAAADLAQTTGQDLNSALLQLSKALEDPARRVTDLSRSGTVFTEQQKEQIRVLQESGNMLGAQNLILQEIEKQYGNAAVAAGEAGFAGAMDSAGESARDLGEAVGTIIVPALENFLRAITPVIENLAKFIDYVSKIPGVLSGIQGASGGLAGMFEKPAEDARQLEENVRNATPAVSELKDQAMNLPNPVQKAGEKMDELKTKTGEVKNKAVELNAELSQAQTPTTATNQELQRQVALLEVAKQQQAAANGEKEVGAQITEMQAQLEQLAAENAALLAANQASANAEINQGAANAANLASQMERAAAAAASLSGGGGALSGNGALGGNGYTGRGLTSGYNKTNKDENFGIDLLGMGSLGSGFAGNQQTARVAGGVADQYKLDSSGNIVERSYAERQADLQRQKLDEMNRKSAFWMTMDLGSRNDEGLRGNYMDNVNAVWKNGGQIRSPEAMREILRRTGRESSNPTYRPFAEGGYVTGPTQAVVGEGGEPEYIIPASKMDGAMQRYSAGMRGSSMIPSNADVTVNYSGSTVDMGGSSYINKGDVTGIVSQAVNQTLTKLQRSSKARLTAGLR